MISVFIIADIRLYREGLADCLAREQDMEVVATAADRSDAVERVGDLVPDVALLDMAMLESAATVRAIARSVPDVRVVGLAVPETEPHVIACAEAGIAGYVPREGSLADLVASVRAAARGEAVCSPQITAGLLRRISALSAERALRSPVASLTAREREIVRLIDDGLSNKEIALRLCIQLATVKNHVHNILEKLQVNRRAEAAARLRLALH